MPRTIVIKIQVDNQTALSAVRAQREESAKLRDEIKFLNDEMRKNEAHAARMAEAQARATKNTESLTSSFAKGFLAARALSEVYSVITSSIGSLITSTANYELTLAKVSAVTGNSVGQLGSLNATIFALGRNTAVSIEEIGSAALELAKLGFEGKNLEIALSGVARLSSILGDSLETTGNLVGGVIQTFDLSATQAATVSDKLFIATGKSATNIEGFRIAFALASNVAHDAGITFEQLSAAIAALSNQGIRASTIGTGLRNFIGELSKEGSKAQKALGGSIEELGLVGAMEKLASLQLKPGSLIELFGKPGAPVASGLGHARDEYQKFVDQITNSEGALEGAKDVINDTLIGSIKLLTNNLLELFNTASSGPASAFKNLFQFIGEGLARSNEEAARATALRAFMESEKAGGRNPLTTLGVTKAQAEAGDDNQNQAFLEAALTKFRLLQGNHARRNGDFNDPRDEQSSIADRLSGFASSSQTKALLPNKLDLDQAKKSLDEFKNSFAEFQAGGIDHFDFKKTEDGLLRLANGLRAIGAEKESTQAFQTLRSVKAADLKNQKEADFNPFQILDKLQEIQPHGGTLAENFINKKHLKEQKEADKELATFKRNFEQFLKLKEEIHDFWEVNSVGLQTFQIGMEGVTGSIEILSHFLSEGLISKGENPFLHISDAFGDMAKKLTADLIALTTKFLIFKAISSALGLSPSGGDFFSFAFSKSSNGLENAALKGLGGEFFSAHANGFDGTINRPHLFLAGEAGPERVKITPLGKGGSGGGADGSTTIIVQGDVFNAEKLVDKINLSNERSKSRYV